MRTQDQHSPAADDPHFVVGRDLEAHWIVIETHGLCGGLFRDEAAALRFAEEECEAYRAEIEISGEPISLKFG
ncbi:MAG: hypothetical protein ACLQL2_08600 [Methylovirgula sp.]